jgi:hypothetical protein
MAYRIGVAILAEDFTEFKKLMPVDERLGRTYAEWELRRRAEDSANGGMQRVTVRPDDFQLYCLQIGQKPSYFMLEAFAAKKAIDITSLPRK